LFSEPDKPKVVVWYGQRLNPAEEESRNDCGIGFTVMLTEVSIEASQLPFTAFTE
jgi:hypothetical protein